MTWVHRSTFALCPAPVQTEPVVLAPFYAWVNQPAAAPSGFAYVIYENVIKTRAAINTVSYLAISMRAWVEPEEITAVSGSARFACAGRCWGWLLTFQPAVTGDRDGDSLVGTASPCSCPGVLAEWGRDPSAAGVKKAAGPRRYAKP